MPGDKVGSWRLRSKCGSLTIAESDKLFFSVGRTSNKAKEFCSDCPVIQQCLEAAMCSDDASYGVWAGTSQRERQKILMKKIATSPINAAVGIVRRVNLVFTD